MLTHPTAKLLYSKLVYSPIFTMTLWAKAALLVYRKCGRDEAITFIALARAAQIDQSL